jgi:tetratricopeptide (TPR) repeat protein
MRGVGPLIKIIPDARRQQTRRSFDTPRHSGYNDGCSGGSNSVVEFLPSKQAVAGSSPVSRSTFSSPASSLRDILNVMGKTALLPVKRGVLILGLGVVVAMILAACIPAPTRPTTTKPPTSPATTTTGPPATTTTTVPPLDAAARYADAASLLAAGRWTEAIAAFDQVIALDPDFAEAYAGRAAARARRTAASSGNLATLTAVIVDAERASELDPSVALDFPLVDSYLFRGSIFLDTGRYRDAVDDFIKAVSLDGSVAASVPAERIASLVGPPVIYQFTEEDYDAILVLYEALEENQPERSVYYRALRAGVEDRLGLLSLATQRYDEALQRFTRAIELNPAVPDYYSHRAEAAFREAGRYRDNDLAAEAAASFGRAVSDYTTAIEKGADSGLFDYTPAYVQRGRCHLYLRDFKAAAVDFSLALQGSLADVGTVYYYRALAYTALGNDAAALLDYRLAYTLTKDSAIKDLALVELQKIPGLASVDLTWLSGTTGTGRGRYITFTVTFRNAWGQAISFQGIPVTVTVILYGYRNSYPPLSEAAKVQVYQASFSATGSGKTVSIPYSGVSLNRYWYYDTGTIVVTVSTMHQGDYTLGEGVIVFLSLN